MAPTEELTLNNLPRDVMRTIMRVILASNAEDIDSARLVSDQKVKKKRVKTLIIFIVIICHSLVGIRMSFEMLIQTVFDLSPCRHK